MKYFFFASSIIAILLTSACGQSGETSTDATGNADGTETYATENNPNIVISNVKPSSVPNDLNEQVATDLLAAYALERTIKPAFEESTTLIMDLRSQVDLTNESERLRIRPMLEGANKLRNSYEEHKQYSLQLDSLTFKIAGGKLSIEEAQKQYLETRNALKKIQARLPEELEQLKALKAQVAKKETGNQ